MAIYSGFTHEKWWFSIATLVYQRVQDLSSLHEALRDAEAAADELTTETTETHRRLVLVAASMGGWIHGESMANPLSPKSHILYTDIYIYYCFIQYTHTYIYRQIYIYICTPNISMAPRIAASLASSRFRHVFGALLLAPTAACSAAKVLPGQGGAVGVNHG